MRPCSPASSNNIHEHVPRVSLQSLGDPQHFEHIDAPLAAFIPMHLTKIAFVGIGANLEDAAAKRCNEHCRSSCKTDLLDGMLSRPALGNLCFLRDRRFTSSRLDDIHANRDGGRRHHLELRVCCSISFGKVASAQTVNAENPEPFDPGFLSVGSTLGKRTERVFDGGPQTVSSTPYGSCLVGGGGAVRLA